MKQMKTSKVERCFYCSVVLTYEGNISRSQAKKLGVKSNPPTRKSRDHIVPKTLIVSMGYDANYSSSLNLVRCCLGCNNYKASLLPLDWLLIMPNNDRARALAHRLVQMGLPRPEVSEVFLRRKPVGKKSLA
mgnify:CR=1 FL=1